MILSNHISQQAKSTELEAYNKKNFVGKLVKGFKSSSGQSKSKCVDAINRYSGDIKTAQQIVDEINAINSGFI